MRKIDQSDIDTFGDIIFDSDLIFDVVVSTEKEDGGQAKIVELNIKGTEDQEEGLFVRVQSWSPNGNHQLFDALIARGFTVKIVPK